MGVAFLLGVAAAPLLNLVASPPLLNLVASAFRRKIVWLLYNPHQIPIVVRFNQRERLHTCRRDVPRAHEIVGLEREQARLVERREIRERLDGIQVVGIHHEKRFAAGPLLRREHGIGGAERLGLHDEADRQPRRRVLLEVASNDEVIGRDDERHLSDACVGDGA